jgi:glycosyltransferase involved in cell wall biosynthesis
MDEVLDGVRVHRCPIHPRKTGALHRFWNYVSFPRAARKYLRGQDGFDAVLVYQLSPVMMAKPGVIYAKKHQVPLAFYCLDLWPESLLSGGIRRGSAVYKYFHRVSARLYRAADRILMTSDSFRSYFIREFAIPESKLAYLPQYAEALFAPGEPKQPEAVTELVFAGNMGFAQGIDTILHAAKLLTGEPVHFSIAGDGSEAERLKALAGEMQLRNVRFLGRLPIDRMPALYAGADAMLVTLSKGPVLSMTLPGKVQSYLAAGKPIIGSADGETDRIIRAADCGYCGPAEDAEALAENIRRFLACTRKDELARNAAIYYGSHFTRNRFLRILDEELQSLVDARRKQP